MSRDRTDSLVTDAPTASPGLTRRSVLQGAAAVGVIGVAGTVLAACGSSGDSGSTGGSTPLAGDAIATTSDVPVGGGLILESPEKIVITQPAGGDFKAFTAVCTHRGCTVGEVVNNVITCPCHKSTFDASTGAVTGGPAPSALASIDIAVVGDQITLA